MIKMIMYTVMKLSNNKCNNIKNQISMSVEVAGEKAQHLKFLVPAEDLGLVPSTYNSGLQLSVTPVPGI